MTGRWGITVPLSGAGLLEQREWIQEIEQLGYTDLWSAEVDGADAFTPLVLAAQWAPSLRLGTAIVPVYTRGPGLIAQSAATAAVASSGRFVLGLGSSSNVIVERWNAVPFEKPYQRVRDTVRFVTQALTGEKVVAEYETFTVNGFRLSLVPPERVPILLAALRPGMLRLAGREADGAIINWLSADDVRTVAPHVRDAAPDGSEPEIVARIFVLLTEDAGHARAIGRQMIASYLNVPVYAAFHEWLGRGDRLGEMWRLWKDGDRKGALAAIPDEVVDELIVYGTGDACRERIERYVEAGVTTPAPMVVPFGDPREAYRALAPR